jgi:hypothetical protein
MKQIDSPYKTIIGLLLGLTILYVFKGYKALPYVVLSLGFLSLAIPKLTVLINRFMSNVLSFLGKFISTILLTSLYYLFLCPLAFFSKVLGGKDPLKLKKPKSSNFVSVNKVSEKESFEKLW